MKVKGLVCKEMKDSFVRSAHFRVDSYKTNTLDCFRVIEGSCQQLRTELDGNGLLPHEFVILSVSPCDLLLPFLRTDSYQFVLEQVVSPMGETMHKREANSRT